MELIKKKFKSMYKTSIIFSIILFLIGLFLLMKPETTLHAISYFVGIVLIIWGIIPVITFFSNKEKESYLEFSFIIGVFALIFGIIVMINPNIIGSIIPLLTGIWMLINGITKLYYALNISKEGNATTSIIISLIILVCGLLLVFNPFGGAVMLTKLIGIFVIVYSVLDLIECYTLNKSIKEVTKDPKKDKKDQKVIEAVYEEE
ncbi:MAG: hypothetical protein E7157_02030 [Lactobacillales bacterium]|nr:hypothetical protein [Lactobacillales bacterium]